VRSNLLQNCNHCGFKKWLKTDKWNEAGIRYWKCGRCGVEQIGDTPFIRQAPKILYFDVENSLTDLYGNFGLTVRGERISHKMIRRPYFMICWSAVWVNTGKMYSGCVTQEEALSRNDKNILAPLWDLMSEADIVAGHNVSYDIKSAHAKFIKSGFSNPDTPKRIMDTLPMARKAWKLESYTLDYICEYLGIKGKDKMSMEDWIGIQETGDPKLLRKMLKYNRGDVRNGVKVLEILKGWEPNPLEFGMQTFPKEPKDKRSSV
jgi:hypothetical protein